MLLINQYIMKRILLILIVMGFLPIASFGQIDSSNTCLLADSATPISSADVFTVSSVDGTAPTPVCPDNTNTASNGEWYRYTPTANYFVTVSSNLTQNGSKDTRLHIYTGACASLQCIAGNDDNGSNFLSTASFSAQAGETYYIAWDNYWNVNTFDFELIEEITTPTISFTTASISAPGSDRGAVDMNGDFLDDIVSISTSTITINEQQSGGGFVQKSYASGGTYSASWSMAAGDFDRNGYNDLVYGNSSGAHVVKANSTGTGYSIAATSNSVFTQRTNFVDFDNDGNLDVFLCDDTAPNEYFINDGTTLTLWEGDASGAPIPGGLGVYSSGGNYGSVWVDYDNDGDSDLFIAKCGGETERRKNQLFRNNGNLSFTEVSIAANMNDPLSTWSSAWGDYDSDGDMDCFVGSSLTSEAHKLMRNNNGVFEDITASAGLDIFTDKGHENQPFDFNNDGYIDIFSNGNILINDGDGTFTVFPLSSPHEGAVGDLNNDGFLDIFNSQVYYNDGNSNNWLKVCLTGTTSNINGIGARIEVSSPSFNSASSKKAQIRDVRSAQGFAYMSTLNTHFGLGSDSSIDTVTIYWPSGTVDIVVNPSINTSLCVTEGETLSLESTITNDLILYPNPTKGLLNLNADYGFENAVYSVFDVTGKRVLNDRFNSNTIDVSELNTGNYILRIIDNGVIKTQKFIKQ
jgi:ASPIC and UnbV/Secretion system C-terminal sorting domain/FG-GAP-like repeat